MMIYLERSLYNGELSFDQANCMFYGMLAIFPELSSKNPVAARAIQAWRRQHIAGEGVPIPVEAMLLAAECFRKEGSGVLGLLVCQITLGRVVPLLPASVTGNFSLVVVLPFVGVLLLSIGG